MMAGMPVVSLATSEYANLLENEHSAFINTDVDALIAGMKKLLSDHALARAMGQKARAVALEQFNMERFSRAWNEVFEFAINKKNVSV
jgi:glycosyltransferase involved in cell wall biosynthesis